VDPIEETTDAPGARPEDPDSDLRREAEAAAASSDFVSAVAVARRILTRRPKSPDAAVFYGKQLQRAKRHAEAFNAFAQALRRAPNHPDALYGHALTALELGNSDDARTSARTLGALRPEDADVKALLNRIMTPASGGE
jgi:Flp pilus assembly protein TadD